MKKLLNRFRTNGFEFIEFVAKDTQKLIEIFVSMGFTEIANHDTHNISQFKQGNIIFILSDHDAYPFANRFFEEHGPSCCSFGISVEHPEYTRDILVSEGCKTHHTKFPCIEGIGGLRLYFVQNANYQGFHFLPGVENPTTGLICIDHITHNVEQGQLDYWADWYTKNFNFQEIRYFNIRGKQTGLLSRAMADPSGKIQIPINEPTEKGSQIQEYLDEYNGPGIQHIALHTDDIYSTVEQMRSNGIKFLKTPDTYYDQLEDRIPGHGEDLEKLKKLGILLDGKPDDETGLLLQIFTETQIGPIFFEIIQRKGNRGFGEGNFQALFNSIEADQIKRGVL